MEQGGREGGREGGGSQVVRREITRLMLQILSGYNLLGSNRIEEAYFCGGSNDTEISPIYGEKLISPEIFLF